MHQRTWWILRVGTTDSLLSPQSRFSFYVISLSRCAFPAQPRWLGSWPNISWMKNVFFSFPTEKTLYPSEGNGCASDWQCNPTLTVQPIMNVSGIGKAHSQMTSKVPSSWALNRRRRGSSSRTVSVVPTWSDKETCFMFDSRQNKITLKYNFATDRP